jgi:uncharacterized protein (TIGR02271 family)
MPLVKLEDFYPNYRDESSDLDDIKHFDVYVQNDEKVGSIDYVLVDEQDGRFRYFVVDTGFWIFGKKVLLPVGLASISYSDRRVYVRSLTKQQVEDLPNFDDLEKVDYDYEERVRGTYRPIASGSTSNMTYDRNTYRYQQEPSLYNLNDRDQKNLKLYEERLIANKQRYKSGEVAIGKRVDTETARVAVPVEKERVVIDRTVPTDSKAGVNPDDAFREEPVAQMEVYEETPDIRKETVVREQVSVRKEIDRDTVDAQEKVRREKLDLDAQGHPTLDTRNRR